VELLYRSPCGSELILNIGGILTVADDLLKNDGKKFIEMMEQLAERRMQREEEASAAASGHPNLTMPMSSHGLHPNNHPPQPQEYEDDEEDEEDEEDYEYEDEEEEDETVRGRHLFISWSQC